MKPLTELALIRFHRGIGLKGFRCNFDNEIVYLTFRLKPSFTFTFKLGFHAKTNSIKFSRSSNSYSIAPAFCSHVTSVAGNVENDILFASVPILRSKVLNFCSHVVAPTESYNSFRYLSASLLYFILFYLWNCTIP